MCPFDGVAFCNTDYLRNFSELIKKPVTIEIFFSIVTGFLKFFFLKKVDFIHFFEEEKKAEFEIPPS